MRLNSIKFHPRQLEFLALLYPFPPGVGFVVQFFEKMWKENN
jgi:penicillin-binding protein-related factor A (putative recombinase)